MDTEGNNLEKRFREFIREKKLVSHGDGILLTVSGGMDSVVMAHLFSKTDFDFGIAHCNFSLRGKESDGDAEFAEELADKLSRPFHLKCFDTKKFAEENKYSIQEAARILRYNWFNELCNEFGYSKIATAHHIDDSIETFFINMLRGTGTAGLRGIPVMNDKIIRPLLFGKRKDIEEYARKNKIKFREDSSNASDDYLRNRIRHHIIPAMKENAEGFEDNMAKLMKEISSVHKMAIDQVEKWKSEFVSQNESGNYLLPLAKLNSAENPSSFLSLLLYSYGITGIECDKVLAAEVPGKVFLAKNFTILRDREFLILQKNNAEDRNTFSIASLPAEVNAGNLAISIRSDVENETAVSAGKKNIYWIDGEKISFPLTLRTWKPGDYFFPLGMKGKKKISDFYTDQKIDRFEKDKIYLLLSGTDIVCILGHRIDERFKIKPTTKKILTIEIKQHDR